MYLSVPISFGIWLKYFSMQDNPMVCDSSVSLIDLDFSFSHAPSLNLNSSYNINGINKVDFD
jgi:hypothetical protein